MRVLHLLNTLGIGNGITNVVVDLSIAQVESGADVLVCGKRGSYVSLLESHGVRFSAIDFADRSVRGVLTSLKRLKCAIGGFAPDIIHVHTIAPLLLCRMLLIRQPIVATVHNDWQRSSDLMKLATIVVGVSESVAAEMVARGIPSSRMRTVPNGVSGSARRSQGTMQMRLEHPSVLYCGSLSLRKGVDVLLEAFATAQQGIPGCHLYLVGYKDWNGIDEYVESLGIGDEVHMPGIQVPFPYYDGADLFVLPSRAEPFGLVLVEAMDAGLPVIGSRVGGVAEMLDAEGGGLSFEPENAVELSSLIVSVLSDAELRDDLIVRSRRVADRHSVAKMALGYRHVYEELI